MLLNLPDFEYVSCRTLEEAYSRLADSNGGAKVYAGGTDLLVRMKHRGFLPRTLVNIKGISGLAYIREEAGGLRVGALTTMREIANSPLVQRKYSSLGKAAGVLGTPQIRALATLGGNLGNASPAAESAPALLVLEASVRIAGPRGERMVPLESFFTGPGKSVLLPDEILVEVQIPEPPPRARSVHLKYGSRKVDVATAGASVLVQLYQGRFEEARIALSSVGPIPFRASGAERLLKGEMPGKKGLIEEVARAASRESSPIEDIRGDVARRRELVEVLVRDAIRCVTAP